MIEPDRNTTKRQEHGDTISNDDRAGVVDLKAFAAV